MTRLRVYLWLFLIGTMRLVHNSQILCPGGKGLKIMVNLIFWMKQTSSIHPVWAGAQPQLRRRAGCERRCPWGAVLGVLVQGLGAACWACPGHLPSSPWTPLCASSQGRGTAHICGVSLDHFTKVSKKPGESKIQEPKVHSEGRKETGTKQQSPKPGF